MEVEKEKKSNYPERGFVPGVRASGVNKSQSERGRAHGAHPRHTRVRMQTKHTLMHIFPGSWHEHTNSILLQIHAPSLSHTHTRAHTHRPVACHGNEAEP